MVTDQYKLLAAAPQPGSALSREREERKRIPENSESARNQPPAVERTLDLALEGRIRTRAYELYVQRGRQDGHSERDWFDAEREILSYR
ncbi:MAG TPA: DUF2934 domain-containing protein [Terriglobales bacterium]|jgi:hypothetical protein